MTRRLVRSAVALAVLAGVLAASACGQSGPLYLPHGQTAPAPATASTSTASPATATR